MSDHSGTTPLDRQLAELHLDSARRTAASRADPAPAALSLPKRTIATSALGTDQPADQQQRSALLRLPHDIRLLIWEEAVGKRYLHLAQSYSEHASSSATALLAQQQHGQGYRGYFGQRCMECKPSCFHCTLLAATEFADFDVKLAARRRANADVRGVVAVLLLCKLVYNEAVPFLYKTNTFQFTSPRTIVSLYDYLRTPRWNSIRTLHLHWSFRAPLFAHYDALIRQIRSSASASAGAPALPEEQAATVVYYDDERNDSILGLDVDFDDDDDAVVEEEEGTAAHAGPQQQQPRYDPTLDSMLYWQHPLLESIPSMEIDRAHWEWEHWRDACAAMAQMRGLRDLRICLRTGLVAAPGQMALFLSPLRDVRLEAVGGSGGAGTGVGSGSGGNRGGGGELVQASGRGAEREVGEDGDGRRWKLGLLCSDRDGWAVQQALDRAGFACDVSRLVAQYWPPEVKVEPPPFNVQYKR
ncbi:hypothetical protein BFW01_g10461 [Lasiodiplodia theobromae]|uniref:DUF7730 domain-containing protein n=1 Tax=Lasiodiplodia theobromae TaxID=45133 RepID=A0A5N5DH74_9PEZI|nr:uncharacterized protein LTHEOB_6633 [Lasiodiplodia theobromae]KAB2576392.1 hypothetical protein DBV05_g4928 [Lasiodiplodia theobromae]KAF4543967.1 hypothetical protein LTHEOB_6633 [Lasiodiplodia theobromae]KAF9629258.1 hypothetical protein BFW01_g10461 [Lasiodiplodia theobromae]